MLVRRERPGEQFPDDAMLAVDQLTIPDGVVIDQELINQFNKALSSMRRVVYITEFIFPTEGGPQTTIYFSVVDGGAGLYYDKAWPILIRELVRAISYSRLGNQCNAVHFALSDGTLMYYDREMRKARKSLRRTA